MYNQYEFIILKVKLFRIFNSDSVVVKSCKTFIAVVKEPTYPEPAPQPTQISQPKTLADGLEQRRNILFESEQKAAKEGNGAKSRRLGRQRKAYDLQIKKIKTGQRPGKIKKSN